MKRLIVLFLTLEIMLIALGNRLTEWLWAGPVGAFFRWTYEPFKERALEHFTARMSNRRIVGVNPWFQTEISNALFKLAVATSIVLDGTTATVTSANHLLTTGDFVTFSGATGVTAINNVTWGQVTVTSSSVYTFPCTLTGSVTGSPVQEKLYFPPAGSWVCTLGANGQLEYNPASTLLVSGLSTTQPNVSLGTDSTWRVLVAATTNGSFVSDGQPLVANGTTVSTACIGSIRFRENGTTATSYFSRTN